MITYTWTVKDMMTVDTPEPGFVTTVVWIITATDQEYTSVYTGASKFYSQDGTFTPYDQLTEEQVISWVQNSMENGEVDALYDMLATQIETQKNPPPVPQSQPLPWL